MRALFDENVEGTDYLELILSTKEHEDLLEKGAIGEFKESLVENRRLNIFIRVDPLRE